MRRTVVAVATAFVLSVLTMSWGASGAVATGDHHDKDQYMTVLWKMDNPPADGEDAGWPQTLVDHEQTDTPDLGAFDAQLTGTCVGYQVDVYHYDEDGTWKSTGKSSKRLVDDLIAGGRLEKPQSPPEPLVDGAEGTAWKFYTSQDCESMLDVKVTPQVCTPGEDGLTQTLSGGTISVEATNASVEVFEGQDTSGEKVTALDGLEPGAYLVRATPAQDAGFGETPEGWDRDSRGVLTKVVTIDVAPDCLDKPADEVEHDAWVDSEWECGDTTVEQTRTVTTTPYVWNADHTALVPDTADATTTQETRTRDLTHEEAGTCPLLPGDIGAECVGDVPNLDYAVDLPDGFSADSDTPLTITFVNPDGDDYVVEDLPLAGKILWPGAAIDDDGNPTGWPGWTQDADGVWVETDGNFAWTREGVTVRFDVNPTYETEVAYPPASSTCANPQRTTSTSSTTPPKSTTPTRTPDEPGLPNTGVPGGLAGQALAGLLVLAAGGATVVYGRRFAR